MFYLLYSRFHTAKFNCFSTKLLRVSKYLLIIIQLITLKLSNKDVLFTSKCIPNFLSPVHKRDKMK